MRNEFDSASFAIADLSLDEGDPATALDLDTRELHRRMQTELVVAREKQRQRRRSKQRS